MNKQTIIVAYGGPSSEHDVSVSSANNVLASLNEEKYDIERMYIHRDLETELRGKVMPLSDALSLFTKEDIVLPVIHGEFGEDGVFEKMLEEKGIRYVYSDSASSLLCFDKVKTQEIVAGVGITVPKSVLVEDVAQEVTLPFPLIVKPNEAGSSIGLCKVTNEEELRTALASLLQKHAKVLVQEVVLGREFTCGVFEKKGDLVALLPTEIILTQGDLFDYTAKYTAGGCDEVTPAQTTAPETKKIQDLALLAHKTLSCRDISRADMIMRSNGELVLLEVNTVPGMTKTSFIPAQAVASGLTLSELLDTLVENHL